MKGIEHPRVLAAHALGEEAAIEVFVVTARVEAAQASPHGLGATARNVPRRPAIASVRRRPRPESAVVQARAGPVARARATGPAGPAASRTVAPSIGGAP